MAEKTKVRACTEEELFWVPKENQPQAKVVPISNATTVAPQPVQLQPTEQVKPLSWFQKNRTIIIITSAVILISTFIIWKEWEKEKRRINYKALK